MLDTPVPVSRVHRSSPGLRNKFFGSAGNQVAKIVFICTQCIKTVSCNLIGGWSHARDLLYTNTLFKAYNNEKKQWEDWTNATSSNIVPELITHWMPLPPHPKDA